MWHYSTITSNGIDVYLPTEGLIVVYVLSPSYFNANTGALKPYYVNQTALQELGISNPNLLLVAYGENLKSSIWANYLITVRITVSTSLFSSAMLFIIVIVVVIIVVLIILLVTMRRKT